MATRCYFVNGANTSIAPIAGISNICYAFPRNPTSDAAGYCYYSLKTPCNVQCNDALNKVYEGKPGVICPQVYVCYKAWFYLMGYVLCVPEPPCLVTDANCTCSQVPSSPTPGQ